MTTFYKRGEGVVHENQRRVNFESFLDHILPIVAVGMLAWLCIGQVTLQQQVAVLIERTSAQNAQVLTLRAEDTFLQSQIDAVRAGRK